MIQKLSIRNFKSIRKLDLDCQRVNVFIGEPNSGKTNILESLALWSWDIIKSNRLGLATRSSQVADWFSDQDINRPITMWLDDHGIEIGANENGCSVKVITRTDKGSGWSLGHAFELGAQPNRPAFDPTIYLFDPSAGQSEGSGIRLSPPFGYNLATLLYSNKEARQSASRFFEGSGLRLNVDFTSKRVVVTKEQDGVLVSFPYVSSSETLRRMVFYNLALDTNSGQILAFDEPEAHSFPPYTKTLAERIALDERGNQFFLTTHSPYMLDSLLSKTPAKDLNVILCRMENFETKAYTLNQDQIDQIKEWSMDAFFNFDRLLPEVA